MSGLTDTKLSRDIKVSVVVAIYNIEDYLEQCLDSLVGQTMQELEVVAVNDGSTDSCEAILDAYAQKHPGRIRAIHQKNGGLSDARNKGIEASQGEFIGFVDGDDWVELDMFERLYKQAMDSQSDIVVCGFNKRYHSAREEHIARFSDKGALRGCYQDFDKSVIDNPGLLFASHSYAWNKLYRKNLFTQAPHTFPVGQWFEDSATIYNVMLDASRVSCVFDGLYNYRIRASDSITSSISPKIFDIFKSCDAVWKYYSQHTDMNSELTVALERVLQTHISRRFDLSASSTSIQEKILALRYITRAFSYLDEKFPNWKSSEHLKKQGRKRVRLFAYLYVFYPSFLIQWKNRSGLKQRKTARGSQHRAGLSQDQAIELLTRISSSLDALSVKHFVDAGTLLGLINEGAVTSHELELGLFADEQLKQDITGMMDRLGHVLTASYRHQGKIARQTYRVACDQQYLSVNFQYYDTADKATTSYRFYTDPFIQYPDDDMCSVVEMSHTRIEAFKEIPLKDSSVPVPENAEALLAEQYGARWRAPDGEWFFWNAPAATPLHEITRIRRSKDS